MHKRIEESKIETVKAKTRLENFVCSKSVLDDLNILSGNHKKQGLDLNKIPPPFNYNYALKPKIKNFDDLEIITENKEEVAYLYKYKERPNPFKSHLFETCVANKTEIPYEENAVYYQTMDKLSIVLSFISQNFMYGGRKCLRKK